MSEPYRIPGQVFKPQADFFAEEFSEYLANNQPYPISRIFDIFPIRPEGEKERTKIIKRGAITISNGNLSNNYGVPTSSSFIGDGIGRIYLTLPKSVSAVASSSATSLSVSFDATPIKVRMLELAPKLGYQVEMLLRQLIFDRSGVTYVFKVKDASNTDTELLVLVDFTLAEIARARRGLQESYEGQQIEELPQERIFPELFSGGCCVVKPGSAPPPIPKDWKQMCQVEFQYVSTGTGNPGPGPGSGFKRAIYGYGEDEDAAVKDAVKRCEWQYQDDKYDYCQIYKKIDCQSRSGS